jgi:hypothetical protein
MIAEDGDFIFLLIKLYKYDWHFSGNDRAKTQRAKTEGA